MQIFVLHVLCRYTRLSGAAVLNGKSAADIARGFEDCWERSFGTPQVIEADGEGAITSKIWKEAFCDKKVDMEFVPPGAHWQLGVERHHPVMTNLINEQAQDSMTAEKLKDGDLVPQDLVNAALISKNSCLMYCGINPYGWAFPDRCVNHFGLGDMLHDEPGHLSDAGRELFGERVRLIQLCNEKLLSFLKDKRIDTALKRRPPSEPRQFRAGQKVDLYLENKLVKKHSTWKGPYTVISQIGSKVCVHNYGAQVLFRHMTHVRNHQARTMF